MVVSHWSSFNYRKQPFHQILKVCLHLFTAAHTLLSFLEVSVHQYQLDLLNSIKGHAKLARWHCVDHQFPTNGLESLEKLTQMRERSLSEF